MCTHIHTHTHTPTHRHTDMYTEIEGQADPAEAAGESLRDKGVHATRIADELLVIYMCTHMHTHTHTPTQRHTDIYTGIEGQAEPADTTGDSL